MNDHVEQFLSGLKQGHRILLACDYHRRIPYKHGVVTRRTKRGGFICFTLDDCIGEFKAHADSGVTTPILGHPSRWIARRFFLSEPEGSA